MHDNTVGDQEMRIYLRGLPTFNVLTDHRLLVGIFKKQLSPLENNRPMRTWEKIIAFTFEFSWVEGKMHFITDALSRAPIFAPEEEELTIDCAITHYRQIKEEAQIMHTSARLQQEEYKQLIDATIEGKDFSKLPFEHPARAYKSIAIKSNMNVFDWDQRHGTAGREQNPPSTQYNERHHEGAAPRTLGHRKDIQLSLIHI